MKLCFISYEIAVFLDNMGHMLQFNQVKKNALVLGAGPRETFTKFTWN